MRVDEFSVPDGTIDEFDRMRLSTVGFDNAVVTPASGAAGGSELVGHTGGLSCRASYVNVGHASYKTAEAAEAGSRRGLCDLFTSKYWSCVTSMKAALSRARTARSGAV